jgi:hypothetical protein
LNEDLRLALSACDGLETLEMHLQEEYDSETGVPIRFVHETWLKEDFGFLPTLSSLSLSIEQLNEEESLLQFVARFPNLKSLHISCAYIIPHERSEFRLPSVTHLSLTTSTIRALSNLLACFVLPSLTELTVLVEDIEAGDRETPLILDQLRIQSPPTSGPALSSSRCGSRWRRGESC